LNFSSKQTGRIINVVLVVLLLVFVFVPDAKSWVMKQMISTGLFNPKIDDKPLVDSLKDNTVADFALLDAKGTVLRISDLKGKIVFINFWATWCPPCRAEMPSLDKLYSALRNDPDIVFLFVSEDDEIQKAIGYFASNQYNFPLYQLSGAAPATIYKGTLPTTVVINKAGRMIYHHEGMANYNAKDFIAKLKSLK
jgi:thiol-disulfide isomerase/thioredoxin